MGGPNSAFNKTLTDWGLIQTPTQLQVAPNAPDPNGNAAGAMQAQELAQAQRRGRASTILTGGAGLMDSPATASQTLLGA